MQRHFDTTGTGAIRSDRARETMPSRVPSTKQPEAASHGTRTRTAVVDVWPARPRRSRMPSRPPGKTAV